MNEYIEKNIILILSIFIAVQPIIDVLTNISIKCNITSIGIIIRMLFIVFLIYYFIFILKIEYKKHIVICGGIIATYLIIYALKNMTSIYITSAIRTFYFPIIMLLLFPILLEEKIKDKYLLLSLLLYTGIIIIAELTNTAMQSYEVSKVGGLRLV